MTLVAPYGSYAWRNWKQNHHWTTSGAPADPLGAGNTALISNLGVTPFLFRDVRKNLSLSGSSVTSLADIKGDGTYGAALVQATSTKQPTWDGTFIQFSGAASPNNQFLLSTSAVTGFDLSLQMTYVFVGTLAGTTGACAFSAGNTSFTAPWILGLTGNGTVAPAFETSNGSTGRANSAVLTSATAVVLVFCTVNVAGTAICTIEIPGLAKVTGTGTPTALASGNVFDAVGAETTGAANAGHAFRAHLAWRGGYTTAQRDTIKTWAATYHGWSTPQ